MIEMDRKVLSLQRRLLRPRREAGASHGHQQTQRAEREATRPLRTRFHLLHQGLLVNLHGNEEAPLIPLYLPHRRVAVPAFEDDREEATLLNRGQAGQAESFLQEQVRHV